MSTGVVNLQLHKRQEKSEGVSYPGCLLWTEQEIRPLNCRKRRCQLESVKFGGFLAGIINSYHEPWKRCERLVGLTTTQCSDVSVRNYVDLVDHALN